MAPSGKVVVRGGLAAAAALWAALAVAVGLQAGTARAGTAVHRPLGIKSSSLTQDGEQLVWAITLDQPFSPKWLARDGRSLCLVIEQVRGAVRGQVCVVGPPHGGAQPQLTYAPVTGSTPGPPGPIAAAIERPDSRELIASFAPAVVGEGYEPLRWQTISAVHSKRCAVQPAGCTALSPARPTLLRLHTPQLVGCQPAGPDWVFQGPTDVREVALTFDDGPWYESPTDNTSRFLDILARERAVATFFEIGEHITTYGEGGAIERRMLADGDMIGDHTWNHEDVARGGAFAAREITQAAAAVRKATGGFEPCLFRAPGGDVRPGLLRIARSLGFATIQWDVDPRDWVLPGTDAIYDNVVTHAHPGAIIIQHDGGGDRSETLAALPHEIDALRRDGYRFVTVTQMLGYRLIYR